MKKGFTCGSFDPITVGHVDMIERAAKLVDKLTVAVLDNKDKHCMFTMSQRLEMVKAAIPHISNVELIAFDGHMPTFVIDNAYDVVIRGLRNGSDFDYEIGLAQLYAKFFESKCEVIYLMTDPKLSYICSNIVRQNFSFGADIRTWVPEEVLKLMKKYYKAE